jgi:hypothetical protein
VLVTLFQGAESETARAVLLVTIGLGVLVAGPKRRLLRAFLVTPLLVLLVGHGSTGTAMDYLGSSLLACTVVFAFALLGQWLLWTIRPDPGHVAA